MKKILAVFLSLLTAAAVEAKIVTGTVTDENGETIIAASVVVKGTTDGTVTDFDGRYELNAPDGATLVFSYVGMKSKELKVTSDVLNVTLSENAEALDEIVVTGYGAVKKRDLVTAVSSVGGDQLKDIPVTSAAEALEGKIAGVQVVTSEGSPDAEVKIRVRGGTSLTQSSEPLYIVDGFPVSSIADIAPGDIASMDVLKDAAATAIYGAQGANGVIIITTKDTKSAESQKMTFHADYTGYMGWREMVHHYDMMNGEDYLRMQYEFQYLSEKGNSDKMPRFFHNYDVYDPKQGRYERTKCNPAVGDDRQVYVGDTVIGALQQIVDFWSDKGDVNWQDEIFGGRHLNSNHSFGFNGGNKKVNFSLSYNRIDDNSIMYASNYVRNNLQAKLKVQPVKGLNIGLNARYSNVNVLGSGTNSAEDPGGKSESRLRNTTSFVPMYGMPVKLNSDDEESIGETDAWNLYNPYTAIDDGWKRKVEHKWSVNGYISYRFKKYFTVKAEAGYEGRSIDQDRYYGPTNGYSKNGTGKSHTSGLNDGEPMGNTISSYARSGKFKETNTFEYHQKFDKGKHDLSILVGEEQTINKGRTNYVYGFGFDPKIPGPETFNHMDLAHEIIQKEYILPNNNMLSFFARANYILFGRYYLTATFRADASTKFTRGNQWGYFPSAAIAWRMIDEPWMEPAQQVMSNWKWRLSLGTVGNNNVDLGHLRADYVFDNTNLYMQDMNDVLIDGKTGSDTRLIAANPNLKWETTITRNLGMDFGFFNERLSGTVDLYWNTTKDLILRYKLATGGYGYQFRNIGSTDNKGVEVSLHGVVLDKQSKRLSYGLTIDANVARNKNTVADLGGMSSYEVSTECFSTAYYKQPYEFYLTPGSAIGDVYGYRTAGIYTTADFDAYDNSYNGGKNLSAWTKDGQPITTPMGQAYPGMTKLAANERGEYEMVKLGNTMPVVNGGFSLSAHVGGEAWGKVDLTANFTYSVGNDVVNLTALDFSTVTSSTKNRNIAAAYGYDKRYTLFDRNGNLIGHSEFEDVVLRGADYDQMAAAVEQANSGKTQANPYSQYTVLTDKFVEDGSFLRMSAINIGYSLSPKWISKAHITNARIFFTASNLFCITKYSGADPEVDTRSGANPLAVGVDFSAFPKSRSFNFGLSLSF